VSQLFAIVKAQIDIPESFGKLAIRMGFITQSQLAELLMDQADQQRPLSQILIEMGAISADEIERQRIAFRQASATSVH
jgi:hypothetical protein